MAIETNKLLLSTQQEKPNHYTYLKEFRVEQCQSFLQHKCNQHRPFVCFNWHFQNQRRRRPIRKRDGTFNYSADNYCTKYDETTGICPDGDDCPFLHRTAGDTERRYHLRYYKTCMCVHDTDSRGYCVKNGHHCAFAHGSQDQRPPVYDIKELEALQNAELTLDGANAQNALDKERNLMNEDPKWQDTNYVLANYKTEPCKRPPRLCRQGYACPQYHNSKDKRRSPRKVKYRSTPCPNVKHGEEWGEPSNCEAGDNCQYCHTRTEQQFHPEIYKSTKCNDVQQAGYCPRSVFCAFAHVEPACSIDEQRDNSLSASLANSSFITRSSAPINIPNSALSNSINDFNSSGFAVNLPYSPTTHNTNNFFSVQDAFNYGGGSSTNKLSNSLSAANQNDCSNNLYFPTNIISPGFNDGLSISPSFRLSELSTMPDDLNSGSLGNSLTTNKNAFSLQSLPTQNNGDVGRMTLELMATKTQALKLSNRVEELQHKLNVAKQEALKWKDSYDATQIQLKFLNSEDKELRNLSIQKLKQLQSKLRTDLEEVEKVLYLENARKCMKCEENNRTVTLEPCNHFILCDNCATSVTECPYCQVPVVTTHT
ncbi:RING finger protein unkempt [Musca vetustissima]|uniref:RING finger protein unkempt n=1 Tax=Musca vetustissima TaxID=27455 RepID=UPI002AB6443E|nr:RING finger protein unkempt [Musca vetustissima]